MQKKKLDALFFQYRTSKKAIKRRRSKKKAIKTVKYEAVKVCLQSIFLFDRHPSVK